MRALEDELYSVEKEAPGTVDAEIFKKSQQEVERIVAAYEAGVNSYRSLGALGKYSLYRTKDIVDGIIARLKATSSGAKDVVKFERLFQE